MASNLPFGSGGLTASLQRLTCPRQHPFGPGHQARYPAGYAGTASGGAGMAVPVSRRLTAHRHSLLGHPVPARDLRLRYLRLTGPPDGAPDPDGVSTFRMREQRPGWAPPRPRGQRCSHGRRRSARPPLAAPPRLGPAPRYSSHLPGLWVTRHQRGFTHVRPSGLPLACAPGWNGPASASSLSFAPRRLPATHVRAGTGLEHWPGAMPPTSSALQSASSLTTCDLVSHVLGPVITCEQPHRHSRQRCRIPSAASGRNISNLIKQCSRHTAGTTSQQRSTLPATGRGTVFRKGSKPRSNKCSPAGGHQVPSLPDGGPANSY